jgi:hypothetical protein
MITIEYRQVLKIDHQASFRLTFSDSAVNKILVGILGAPEWPNGKAPNFPYPAARTP